MLERSPGGREIRLICKLQPGSRRVDALMGALEAAGYTIEGNSILRGSLKAEFKAASLSGDEAIILVKSAEADDLRGLLSLLARECWYIDVYYHLRGGDAWAAARSLEMQLPDDGVYRSSMKLSGVELRVDAYPGHGALTISYRAGWREVNSGAVTRIHEKILGAGGGRSIFSKLMGWVK
ncbi:MAG: hypothetical protein QW624_02460 [Nitrososphaerota archaeon]